jgi:hypothetical protein
MTLSDAEDPRNIVLRLAEEFAGMGIPVFPIFITQTSHGGITKWDKRPLVPDWVNAASTDWRSFSWDGANGAGLRMGPAPDGGGWYALDIDAHKPNAAQTARNWIAAHEVPKITRQHRTVSGGWHLLYRLPAGWVALRTRANIVPGLDSRGQGGFIAFGRGYKVVMQAEPAVLPERVCAALNMAPASGPLTMGEMTEVDRDDTLRRVLVLCKHNPRFLHRWQGGTAGLTDRSRSALDMSVARLLVQAGFSESEVSFVLISAYRFGQAGQLADWRGERAARRCAARAIQDMAMEFGPPKTDEDSAEIAAEMRNVVRGVRNA